MLCVLETSHQTETLHNPGRTKECVQPCYDKNKKLQNDEAVKTKYLCILRCQQKTHLVSCLKRKFCRLQNHFRPVSSIKKQEHTTYTLCLLLTGCWW